MSLPSLRLNANADRRIRGGHLWVFSNEVDTALTPLTAFEPGQQAQLEAAVAAPLPPSSADYALDVDWWDAQDNWIEKCPLGGGETKG